MVKIALFAEGHTDQLVLKNVLLGGSQFDEEPEVHFVQPLAPGAGANGSYAPGGWTVLFDALRRGEHRKALQYNDLLVIHVDTDVCDEVGFGVPKVDDPDKLATAVQERLCTEMGPGFCSEFASRVLFAIAVDEIECWLLPLLFDDQKAKQGKTTGCLEAADRELARRNRDRLSVGGDKNPKSYQNESRPLLKPRTLQACAPLNPSLGRFVAAWAGWQREWVEKESAVTAG